MAKSAALAAEAVSPRKMMRAPKGPSFQAAIEPRTAIEKPCPPKRIVA